MTTATKSVKKHVWDWAELEAAIKAGVSPVPTAKISEEGRDNASWVAAHKYASESYVQLCDRVFAKNNGSSIDLFYIHRSPGSSSKSKMFQVKAYPAAQGRTMYEVVGKQMHWFAERYLPDLAWIKQQKAGSRQRMYGQKGVYQNGDGPVYMYTGISPDGNLLQKALELLRSYGASDEMMQAASVLGGQLADKVAPYRDCILRYSVEARMDDMYFAATFPEATTFSRHRRTRDYIQLPASMAFDCLLFHPMRELDNGRYGRSWVEPPAMRVGVCMINKFSDAETKPLFHVNSVHPGHTCNYLADDDVPLLDVMLTQHMHKLWTPVTEWLAQNVYVPGV